MSDLQDDDSKSRSDAARAMGRARTPAKKEASLVSLVTARQSRWADPEARERFAQAIRDSWKDRKKKKEQESNRE